MHGALGLRVVAREWLRCTPGLAASAAALYGIGVVVLGGLAVAALA